MKKLLGIVVLGLMWCNVGFADEIINIYIRCSPEVTTVRYGDLKVGDKLWDRIIWLKYKNEIDLRVSDKPEKVLKKYKIYAVNDKGKKNKLSYGSVSYRGTQSVTWEDRFESKEFIAYTTMNVNYDGTWVGSSTVNINSVEGGKKNFSWFGKCSEISKKEFKKPVPNDEFKGNK